MTGRLPVLFQNPLPRVRGGVPRVRGLERIRGLPRVRALPRPARLDLAGRVRTWLGLRQRPKKKKAPGRLRRLLLTAGAWAGWTIVGAGLFAGFLQMSRTVAVNSDGASNALQAWSMLHGNLLLHGWQLSDVSFYTTELPEYMAIEHVRGLSPDVVHVAAALTYTFAVLLAALVAKGRATGWTGLVRAGIAAGIMLAPQRSEVTVLMLSPDHVGSTVPILLAWLLVDRAGRRWYVPVGCFVLLAMAEVADQIVLLTGVAPIVLVALIRGYERVVRQRAQVREVTFEAGLLTAGLAAPATVWRVLALLRAHGGFEVFPVNTRLIGAAGFPHNLLQAFHGILLLFGADFLGQRAGIPVAIALLHLIGVGLAAWGLCAAVRRFLSADLVAQLLAAATVISLAAYLFGPNASEALSSREFAAVLPFGAALAGRMLAGRLSRARLIPALAAVLAVYLVGAARVVRLPPVPAENQPLAAWLASHGLTDGLSEYWIANSVTLDSGGHVQVAALRGNPTGVWPYHWESQPSWYNPALHVADFVVLPSDGVGPSPGPGTAPPLPAAVLDTFGQPAKVYFLADYTVLVWNSNILARMTNR